MPPSQRAGSSRGAGGRASTNKVTKPTSKPRSRPSSVPQEAVNQLAVAAAEQVAQAAQHHHDPTAGLNAHDHQHLQTHASPEDDQHLQNHASPEGDQLHHHQQLANLVSNGPDPAIHPDLQLEHAQFAMDHQTMDQQIQEAAAAAAAVSQPRTTTQLVKDSGYEIRWDNTGSNLIKRLLDNPGRRLAKQRRGDQSLNLQRRSNIEALLAQVAGQEAASACKNCHKGHGPWTECVVVEGHMCGSCANCWYNASGARCSFHGTSSRIIC